MPPPRPTDLTPQDLPLELLFEDDSILVVHKPTGLTVHPGAGQPDGTLANALAWHMKDLPELGGSDRPGIVHRLDKETSGVMVVARTEAAQRKLSAAFAERKIQKTYLACAHGHIADETGKINQPIGRAPRHRTKMAVNLEKGRPAFTAWRIERRLPRHTLVRCHPRTGRTHQIRVHMLHLGHPIVGDKTYGNHSSRGRERGAAHAAPRVEDRFPAPAHRGVRLVRGSLAAGFPDRPRGAGGAGAAATQEVSMSDTREPTPLERWLASTYAKATERFPERKEAFRTTSGIELDPCYAGAEDDERVGLPGEPPFTRGVQPTMYRGRFWTMRQYAGFATAEESNRRYRALLEQGTTGLSSPSTCRRRSATTRTTRMAAGEVGRVGVSIATLEDMETLLDGIPLDKISISMTINSTAIVLLAFLIAVAKKQGVDPAQLRGTVQNDMFKEFIARGTQRLPVRPVAAARDRRHRVRHEEHAALQPRLHQRVPHPRSRRDGRRGTGVHPRRRIGYVQAALDRGLDVDAFAPRLSFFFNAHNNLFEEVAKFRAARRMWAGIMQERFGAKNPKSLMLRFHTQTAGSTLQARQVDVNVVRVTMQALAAVLGGTQSLHTNGRDEALNLPSEEAAVLALRTQQVLAHESGVTDVVDPLGGSPMVESLTDSIQAEAEKLIAKIDEIGGTLAAVEQGLPQRHIEHSAYEAQRRIESGEDVVVGVNRFEEADTASAVEFELDPAMETTAVERVRAFRAARDEAACAAALERLEGEIAGTDNLMPFVLACVEAGATIGEVMARLEARYGTFLAPAAN